MGDLDDVALFWFLSWMPILTAGSTGNSQIVVAKFGPRVRIRCSAMETTPPSRWFALCRTVVFATLFVGFLGIYLPRYLGLLNGRLHTGWRLIGFAPFLAGAYIAFRCAFAFAWTGLGTPAPFDPPRRLVVTGLYRYVRNPMYFGMGLFLIGEWMLWGSNPRGALAYLACLSAAVALLVLLYEEPTLRRKFPEDYAEYSRSVPRFFPRLQPWNPNRVKSAH